MEIGLITNILSFAGYKNLVQVADFCAENGFTVIEIGPMTDVSEEGIEYVLDRGLKIHSFIYCRNFTYGPADQCENYLNELKWRIELAAKYGIEFVTTSTGKDPTKDYEANFALFEQTFTEIAELAEQKGVKICFENCPDIGNIAISPVIWDKIFTSFPTMGLCYDPSHLVRSFIDPYQALEDYYERITYIHGKDVHIFPHRLRQVGTIASQDWWEYRIPGWGDIDWKAIFIFLLSRRYDGVISIEHEDRAFVSSKERMIESFQMTKGFLESCFLNKESL